MKLKSIDGTEINGQGPVISEDKYQELMAQSSGYVRDSFVMASLDQFSEYEHLEKILLDTICDEPVKYDEVPSANEYRSTSQEKYRKYQKEKYTPEPHYQREE